MFESPGNGYLEKTALVIVVMVSLFLGMNSLDPVLTGWYAFLGVGVLYLAWEFQIFSFSPDAWAEKESTEWSAQTLGEAPTDYINAVSDFREHIVPRHDAIWWLFRILYVLLGCGLLLVAVERFTMGTNQALQLLFSAVAYL